MELNRDLKLPYTPAQMYALVADIERYPEFLPYCQSVHIRQTQGQQLQAEVVVGYKGLQHRFTTQNTNTPDAAIAMRLLQGPLKTLNGEWHFKALDLGCEVSIVLQAEFSSRLLNMMLKNKMQKMVDKFIDAFVQRARELYA